MADRKEREEGLKRRLAQKEKERDIARRLGAIGAGAGKEYMTRAATRTNPATTATHGSSFSSVGTSSFSSAAPVSSATTSGSSFGADQPPRWDARALGLVGRRGADQPNINLGPAPSKRKRPESSGSCSTTGGWNGAGQGPNNNKAALGWGSSLSTKLGRMKEGERLDGRKITALDSNPPPLPALSAAAVITSGGGGAARRGDKSPVRKKTRFVTEKGIREAGRESLGETLSLSAALKTRRQVVLDEDEDDDLIILK
jgi:minichromosome maintenance protein 10